MKFRRVSAVAVPIVVLLAVWYLPLSAEERHLAELKRSEKWLVCDYRREDDKLFTLRLYTRISPLLLLWNRYRHAHGKAVPFGLKVFPEDGLPAGADPYYWDDLRASVPPPSRWLRYSAWDLWASRVEELLDWEYAHPTRYSRREQTRFEFTPQPSAVERTGAHELTVRLDAGVFAPEKEKLAGMIERAWSVPPNRLRVNWVSNDARAFRFVLDREAYHAHVDYGPREVRVSDWIHEGTMGHEVGHILGFRDHYESYLDEDRCKLVHRAFLRDLMANSAVLHALPGHWKVLDRAYARDREPARLWYGKLEVLEGDDKLSASAKTYRPR